MTSIRQPLPEMKIDDGENGVVKMPLNAYPNIHVSNRILFVTFILPIECAVVKEDRTWKIRDRRGNSALYSSAKWIGIETDWDLIHVGWTGEVDLVSNQSTSRRHSVAGSSPEFIINKYDMQSLDSALQDNGKPDGITYSPIWLLEEGSDLQCEKGSFEQQKKWRLYGELVLWPLFHYLLWNETDGREEDIWWKDFVYMNELFAQRIIHLYKPGDIGKKSKICTTY